MAGPIVLLRKLAEIVTYNPWELRRSMDRTVKPGENIYPKILWYQDERGGFNFRAYFGNEREKST